MTVIVVEDGTVVTGANSYVTEAELTAYATARNVTLTGATDELIVQAMDYIEGLSYIGVKSTSAQPLQFPRYNVVVDGYLIETATILQILKDGQMEAAIAVDAGNDPLANVTRQTKKEKVDVLEVEYMDNAVSNTIVKKISTKLRKLLVNSNGGISFPVTRG